MLTASRMCWWPIRPLQALETRSVCCWVTAMARYRLNRHLRQVPARSALAVADINADGKPDIITANGTANVEAVLLGTGNGTFQSPKTFATGSGPAAVPSQISTMTAGSTWR